MTSNEVHEAYETYYLIDFENVHEDGMSGAEKLNQNDHVHIFFTKNAPKISIQMLACLNSTDLQIHEIPTGKQSLDMHLVSFLGYLIGVNHCKHQDSENIDNDGSFPKCEYIIISKDTDYDNIIIFWQKNYDITIKRQNKIAAYKDLQKEKSDITLESQEQADIEDDNISKPEEDIVVDVEEFKVPLKNELEKIITYSGYKQDIVDEVSSIVLENYSSRNFLTDVHNELRDIYTDYLDVYNIIKPILKKYNNMLFNNSSEQDTQSSADLQKISSDIKRTLSKADFDVSIINIVVSMVEENYYDSNSKMLIYRSIIAKYGKNKGLNIYNHIKKYI